MRKIFYIYLMRCTDGTFYIGKTDNITKRFKQHNGLLSGGAKYTRSRRPVTLQYIEIFTTRSEALKREVALKKLTRPQKEKLIQIFNV